MLYQLSYLGTRSEAGEARDIRGPRRLVQRQLRRKAQNQAEQQNGGKPGDENDTPPPAAEDDLRTPHIARVMCRSLLGIVFMWGRGIGPGHTRSMEACARSFR